jgi:hypothetical protein
MRMLYIILLYSTYKRMVPVDCRRGALNTKYLIRTVYRRIMHCLSVAIFQEAHLGHFTSISVTKPTAFALKNYYT